MAQIRGLSLTLAALGLSTAPLDRHTIRLITPVGLITISGSTYMILYSHRLYMVLALWLAMFDRRVPYAETRLQQGEAAEEPDVILFGIGRFGAEVARILTERGVSVLAVDSDPDRVRVRSSEEFALRGSPSPRLCTMCWHTYVACFFPCSQHSTYSSSSLIWIACRRQFTAAVLEAYRAGHPAR